MKNVWIALLSALNLLTCLSCQNDQQKGEQLATVHCRGCHEYTGPELLDKETWEKSVLPEMAFRMGLPSPVISKKSFEELPAALPTIPGQPIISQTDFDLITKYFLSLAPDSLGRPKKDEPTPLSQFEPLRVSLSPNLPMVTMLQTDSDGRIFVGNRDRTLLVLQDGFSVKEKYLLDSPPAFAFSNGQKLVCLEMGTMDPNDKTNGKLVELSLDTRNTKTIIHTLKRPVYFEKMDLNGDQLEDFVICEFGNYTGKLEVFENLGNEQYKAHTIDPTPGARKIILKDCNGDGKTDIIALMTQADERINLYTNRGNFDFSSTTLLRFPAVYGSSYFEINDFNKDGFFDILYANGDNSDYSTVLKPYHGVRLFLNDGHQQFKESWFYPMYGATWAMARDFDQDGDLDIAAIAFFPDFKKGADQGFIYFENRDGKFLPFITPESTCGRWLVMDVADVDNDKDLDILLGALDFKPSEGGSFEEWKKQPTSLLVLKNKLH